MEKVKRLLDETTSKGKPKGTSQNKDNFNVLQTTAENNTQQAQNPNDKTKISSSGASLDNTGPGVTGTSSADKQPRQRDIGSKVRELQDWTVPSPPAKVGLPSEALNKLLYQAVHKGIDLKTTTAEQLKEILATSSGTGLPEGAQDLQKLLEEKDKLNEQIRLLEEKKQEAQNLAEELASRKPQEQLNQDDARQILNSWASASVQGKKIEPHADLSKSINTQLEAFQTEIDQRQNRIDTMFSPDSDRIKKEWQDKMQELHREVSSPLAEVGPPSEALNKLLYRAAQGNIDLKNITAEQLQQNPETRTTIGRIGSPEAIQDLQKLLKAKDDINKEVRLFKDKIQKAGKLLKEFENINPQILLNQDDALQASNSSPDSLGKGKGKEIIKYKDPSGYINSQLDRFKYEIDQRQERINKMFSPDLDRIIQKLEDDMRKLQIAAGQEVIARHGSEIQYENLARLVQPLQQERDFYWRQFVSAQQQIAALHGVLMQQDMALVHQHEALAGMSAEIGHLNDQLYWERANPAFFRNPSGILFLRYTGIDGCTYFDLLQPVDYTVQTPDGPKAIVGHYSDKHYFVDSNLRITQLGPHQTIERNPDDGSIKIIKGFSPDGQPDVQAGQPDHTPKSIAKEERPELSNLEEQDNTNKQIKQLLEKQREDKYNKEKEADSVEIKIKDFLAKIAKLAEDDIALKKQIADIDDNLPKLGTQLEDLKERLSQLSQPSQEMDKLWLSLPKEQQQLSDYQSLLKAASTRIATLEKKLKSYPDKISNKATELAEINDELAKQKSLQGKTSKELKAATSPQAFLDEKMAFIQRLVELKNDEKLREAYQALVNDKADLDQRKSSYPSEKEKLDELSKKLKKQENLLVAAAEMHGHDQAQADELIAKAEEKVINLGVTQNPTLIEETEHTVQSITKIIRAKESEMSDLSRQRFDIRRRNPSLRIPGIIERIPEENTIGVEGNTIGVEGNVKSHLERQQKILQDFIESVQTPTSDLTSLEQELKNKFAGLLRGPTMEKDAAEKDANPWLSHYRTLLNAATEKSKGFGYTVANEFYKEALKILKNTNQQSHAETTNQLSMLGQKAQNVHKIGSIVARSKEIQGEKDFDAIVDYVTKTKNLIEVVQELELWRKLSLKVRIKTYVEPIKKPKEALEGELEVAYNNLTSDENAIHERLDTLIKEHSPQEQVQSLEKKKKSVSENLSSLQSESEQSRVSLEETKKLHDTYHNIQNLKEQVENSKEEIKTISNEMVKADQSLKNDRAQRDQLVGLLNAHQETIRQYQTEASNLELRHKELSDDIDIINGKIKNYEIITRTDEYEQKTTVADRKVESKSGASSPSHSQSQTQPKENIYQTTVEEETEE